MSKEVEKKFFRLWLKLYWSLKVSSFHIEVNLYPCERSCHVKVWNKGVLGTLRHMIIAAREYMNQLHTAFWGASAAAAKV